MIYRILAILFACLLGMIVCLANNGLLYDYVPNVNEYPGADKVCHFLLMGTMAFLTNLALRGRKIQYANMTLYVGSLIVLILVTLEELSQIFVSSRNFDFIDLIFDILGIFFLGNLGGKIAVKKESKIRGGGKE
jgi:VanZ family protein